MAKDVYDDRHWMEALLASTLVSLLLRLALMVQLHLRWHGKDVLHRRDGTDEFLAAFSMTSPSDAECLDAQGTAPSGPSGSPAGLSEGPSPTVRVLRA
jgi:hypothetical protein